MLFVYKQKRSSWDATRGFWKGGTVSGKKASKVKNQSERSTIRFSVDLDPEQHRFLKLFSIENGIQASVIMRALIYQLEVNEELANRVIDEIFAE